jgi:hypothetical protein
LPLPSLYLSGKGLRAWSVTRSAGYGGAIGALAALLKTLGPLHGAERLTAGLLEVAAVTIAFALLCAGAAALRNFIALRLISDDRR